MGELKTSELKRGLNPRHLQMIATGGAIGTRTIFSFRWNNTTSRSRRGISCIYTYSSNGIFLNDKFR